MFCGNRCIDYILTRCVLCFTKCFIRLEVYRKISNIRRTKLRHLDVSHLVLQLPLPNPFNACIKSLRWRQNGRHFADDTLKRFFLNGNVSILIKILLRFVPNGPINNIPAFVQIMAWRRPSDKPLSEPMMIISLTHICVTRPQWVKLLKITDIYRYVLWKST